MSGIDALLNARYPLWQPEKIMALPPLFDKLRLPAVGAPQFIIANPELVIAQCKAGIVGSFPALNARPETTLDDWLYRIKDELAAYDEANPDAPAAPYAVNQIVHKTNARLDHDVAACVKHKVPIVITSLGARPEVNDAIHSYGGIVLHDVINIKFAEKALEKGADGLIAVAAGAGGHAGGLSPIAFIDEIRQFFKVPLLLSGAIGTGRGILAAQAMGADLDRMFLETMIRHHQGAIRMAEVELDEGSNADVLALAQGIIDGQQAEIDQMQSMLEDT